MGRFLTSVFLFAVLVLAAALILPSFIDWTAFRPQIEAQASRVLGRQVSIRGDIGLRLLPAPELRLGDLSVADPADAERPLLSAGRLEAVAAWGPLFSGTIEVRRLHLVEPIVRLEIDGAGATNWRLGGRPAGTPEREGGSDFLGFWSLKEIGFSDVTIERGLVMFADARSGAADQIDAITGRLALARLTGPAEGDILFRIADAPMRLGFRLASFADDTATPLSFKLGIGDGTAELTLDGKVGGLAASRAALSLASATFEGTLEGKAAEAGPLAHALGVLGGFGRPARPSGPLLPEAAQGLPAKLAARLLIAPENWSLEDFSLRLGQTGWTGHLVRGRTDGALAGSLSTDLVYLDELKPSGADGAGTEGLGLTVPGVAAPIKLLAGCGCEGTFAISAERLLFGGVTLSDLMVGFGFSRDGAKIERAAIALPGQTAVLLTGDLKPGSEAGLLFDGTLSVASEEARQFFSWLDLDLGQVEPSRLRSFALEGGLRLVDRAAASRSGLRTGAVRPVVVPEIEQASLVLDGNSYRTAFAANPVHPPALRFLLEGESFDAAAYGLSGALWPAAPLDAAAWGETSLGRAARFDILDLDVRLGELGLGKHSAKDFALAVNRSADGLALADVSIEDLAGYAVDFEGSRLVDAETRVPLSKARLEIKGGQGGGFVLPFAEQPLSREIEIEAVYDEAPGAARLKIEGEAGGLRLSGAAEGTPRGQLVADFDRLELSAALKEGRAVLGGSLSGLSGAPVFEGNLTVDALSFPAYVRALGYAYEPRKRDLGALSVVAQLGLSAEAVRVPRFAVSVGDQAAAGKAALSLGGERAVLNADLDLGAVSLNGFLPKPDDGLLWSTDELALDFLERADGAIRLGAERFEVYAFDLMNVTANLALEDGVLSTQGMTAGLYGGALSLTGRIATKDGVVDLAGRGAVTKFDLAEAAGALAPNLGISGRGDISFDVSAKGATQLALAQSLSGEGRIEAGAGRLQGLDLATWSAGLGKVQSPERFLRLAKDTLGAGASPFNGFSGAVAAQAGTLRTQDLRIDFDKANARLSGTVSLPTKSQALRLRLDLKERTDLPPATLVYTGLLGEPQRTYDLAALQKVMLARFREAGAGRISVDDLPPDLQELLKTQPAE